MKFVLLFAFVAGCVAQVPKPCDSPKQWVGTRVFNDDARPVKVVSRVFYDAVNMRVRDVEEVEQGKEKDFYDVLRLHMTNKEYRVDLRTKKCNVTTIKEPWRPIGIPADAKFMYAAEVGPSQIPLEHFTSYTFYGNFTDNVEYVMTHTFPSCVPVAHTYRKPSPSVVSMPAESRYFNIHAGMYNASNFDIPKECM